MISTSLKHRLKAPFRAVGLDLVVRRPYPLQFLASYGIRTVLDVGAHEGGFAEEVRAVLPSATLHSFEPVGQTFRQLKLREKFDPRFRAWNLAIGERTGQTVININALSASSSLLPLGTLTDHWPQATMAQEETVAISTLDDWYSGVDLDESILLKADVQGYEDRVLMGASRLLERVSVIVLEVSFEEFYVGQPLFDDIYNLMRRAGFSLKGMYDPLFDVNSERQIQSNAIFDRAPISATSRNKHAGN
jgi:FkbM family methyltransferase